MEILQLIKRLPIDLGQGYYRHTTKAKLMAFQSAGKPPGNERAALDFGCGDGYWSDRLKERGWQVTSADGYDFRYPQTREVNAEQPLPFADNTFDLIWSVEVIEHVRHVELLIAQFQRILKPGGRIIITTPNSAFWLYQILKLFGITPAQVQNPDHKQFFSLNDIRRLFPGALVKGFFPYALVKIPIRRAIGLLSPTFVIIGSKHHSPPAVPANSLFWKRAALALLLTAATLAPRLTNLGTILTNDEPLWLGRSAAFVKSLATGNFAGTATSIQPGVTTTWIGGLAAPFGTLAAAQAGIAIATSVLVLLITYFLVRLWGWRWGMVGGAVLALDPFLIAHSRVLHTDALLGLLLLLSMVSLLAAFPQGSLSPRRRYLIVSSVACALAVLTKIFALAILPAVAGYIMYAVWRSRRRWQSLLQYGLLWLAIFVMSSIAAWPALWTHAGQTIHDLVSGVTKYGGDRRAGEITAQWWYYLREGVFRLSAPVAVLALFGIAGVGGTARPKFRNAALLLAVVGIAYAVILSLRGEKSDRYILFTLLTINLVGVWGLSVVASYVKRIWPRTHPSASLLAALLLVFLGVTDWRLHPYYLAHYNALYPLEADHKLGWGEGLEQAADYLETNHAGASVASYYSSVFSHFYRSGPTVGLTGDTNADYLVLYRSMFERGPDHPDTDLIQQYVTSGRYRAEHIITVNDLPYVWIVKNE